MAAAAALPVCAESVAVAAAKAAAAVGAAFADVSAEPSAAAE